MKRLQLRKLSKSCSLEQTNQTNSIINPNEDMCKFIFKINKIN